MIMKKGEDYATTVSWLRAQVSFAILRSALLKNQETDCEHSGKWS